MRVVIRADGGPDIGYGHLVRTSALAEELHSLGHRVGYATTTPEHVAEVCPSGVDLFELTSREDSREFLESVPSDTGLVVIDSYVCGVEYQQSVRDGVPLAVVSDRAGDPVCADLLLNGNIYAESLSYDFIGEEPESCLGPEYVLFRDSIATLVEQEPPARDPPRKAVVTFGGSDIANLTPTAIHAFEGSSVDVTAIVGPGFSNEAEVREAASATDADVSVVRDPPNFAEIVFDADFAVSACGSTVYELLSLGTPPICTPVVDNQRLIAESLRESELGIVIDPDEFRSSVAGAVDEYVRNDPLREQHRQGGRALIDGHGTERACNRMLSVAELDESP